jgi:hypothetical protein
VAYFGGVFGMTDAAPTRVAFTQIPDLHYTHCAGKATD